MSEGVRGFDPRVHQGPVQDLEVDEALLGTVHAVIGQSETRQATVRDFIDSHYGEGAWLTREEFRPFISQLRLFRKLGEITQTGKETFTNVKPEPTPEEQEEAEKRLGEMIKGRGRSGASVWVN